MNASILFLTQNAAMNHSLPQQLYKVLSKIQYVSDLHLESGFKRIIKAEKPYLLLGGDIGYPSQNSYQEFLTGIAPRFDKVYLLAGNHEYDFSKSITATDETIRNICEMRNNIQFLQKDTDHIIENVFIAGCTFWSSKPETKFSIHRNHKSWLIELLKQNPTKNFVVATHHAMSPLCLYTKTHANNPDYFASENYYELISRPNFLFNIYGHTHYNKNIRVSDKWLLTNQYGKFEAPLKNYNKL